MSLLTLSSVKARAARGRSYNFSAGQILAEKMTKQAKANHYDIFLSHAFSDKDTILGTTETLEDLGYSVYVDWRDDPGLDRQNVNPATAEILRSRMKMSRSLFYATTSGAATSRWMPWELGFKDGDNNKSAILPIEISSPTHYKGLEYLGIYPYILQSRDTEGKERLWVHKSPTCYVEFRAWLEGRDPFERA
jgi:hypothetical protein